MPFAERAGVRIHYRDEGAGLPLVLHTGGAGDGTMWDGAGYTGRLGEFRLLVVDHRGRGQSSHVRSLAGHARAEYAQDVVAVADAAGVERFAFTGYSMGADDLARIECPTALIAGSGEAPAGSLERMRAAIPGGAAIARIAGRGHVGAFLDSEAVLSAALPVLTTGRGEVPR